MSADAVAVVGSAVAVLAVLTHLRSLDRKSRGSPPASHSRAPNRLRKSRVGADCR